ncbi:MAG: flagellar hook-basal body complex protein [candidate division KSB1 bacterium]|nr:flagellar hook-basal body complex protein [candidate division KSB1 bacterium]
MLRSLFAGVSGLRGHQLRMDVIGNNISNVNTIGFKAGRANFRELLAITLRGATRPTSTTGGTDPLQIGLGMGVSTIDTIFSQGNLETTGKITDLAIDGTGFFILRSGKTKYYTRAGAFSFDSNGRLVDPASGWVVQGKMADESGNIPSSSVIEDIILPFGQKAPAKATTKIEFTGNLDGSQVPLPTILDTGIILAIEKAGDNTDMNGLYANGQANSFITGLVAGVTTITVNDGTTEKTYTYVQNDTAVGNGQFRSLDDLIAEINNDFESTSFRAALDSNGAIVMTDTSGVAHTLKFTSNNPVLQTAFAAANGEVDSSSNKTTKTDEFSRFANKNEKLINLRNSIGTNMGLVAGNVIEVSAVVGDTSVSGSITVTDTMTLEDLTNELNTILGINSLPGVSIDSDGSITIQGDPGEDNAISSVALRVASNTTFNTAMSFVVEQEAKDITHSASITVFDALGEEHVITLTFKKTSVRNQWTWTATTSGDEIISSGSSGKITFNANGSLNSFTFDNGLTTLKIDPNNGAEVMDISLDVGTLGGYDGITQFASASTAVARYQDGYSNGDLDEISIDRSGKITGVFSNGVTKTLAQISLATFNNPGGLIRVGGNAYLPSGNSGVAIIGEAGESIQAEIIPGTLEMSNVDLAQEFTNMIIAQRGFQANSRVITTSDEMLTELVNLKR